MTDYSLHGIPVTAEPLLVLAAYLILLDIILLSFILPAVPRSWLAWGEGWLIPHHEKQEVCRVHCATCR